MTQFVDIGCLKSNKAINHSSHLGRELAQKVEQAPPTGDLISMRWIGCDDNTELLQCSVGFGRLRIPMSSTSHILLPETTQGSH